MAASILAGIRVVDLSGYIAGPYACSLLADMGADVVKVEPPGGDQIRHYPSTLPGASRVFLGVNRGKRGIVLDLKTEAGAAALRKLVARADVLVENFRPGVMDRLGFGYGALKPMNPRLIYCALTGFGHAPPMAGHAGFDQVLQAMTGMNVFQGAGAGAPPTLVWGSPVDFYAASLATSSILAALYHRERTGEGQFTTLSLLAAALAMQAGRFVWADGEPKDAGRDLAQGRIAGIHPTKAGHIYLSASTDRFWQNLCRHLGLDELSHDPLCSSVKARAENADLILPKLHAALAHRTAVEWEERLSGDVPCTVVRPIEEMFDHPQVAAESLVASFVSATGPSYRGLASPFKFGACPSPAPRSAPSVGEHTDEVLRELKTGETADAAD